MIGSVRRIAGRRLTAAVAIGMLAVCLFAVSRLLASKGLVWATNIATIASFILAAATPTVLLLGKLIGWLSGTPPVSAITLAEARTGLAEALAEQWAEQDRLRQVYDPYPLPVRWRPADGEIEGFHDINAVFTHASAQRLVILGPAGAGKSVLATKLVRDLLGARTPGDRVPVLLAAATWTRDCTMIEWITEQLVTSQPSLDVRIITATGEKAWLPRALAKSGLIPVVDGLDELPPDRWRTVISEINAFGSDYPLVLTSRPEEYQVAIGAREISRALVIELEPLGTPEIRAYLTEATDAPADRWQNVFDDLGAVPGGVLAQTLATPLMIWLARTIYQDGDSEPDGLLDPSLLADRAAMESHLVAAFVPAAYSARQNQFRSFRCSPEQATRWLGFLADRLNRSKNQEIAWWQLKYAEPVLLIAAYVARMVLYTCIFWEVSVWALTRRGYWRDGAYIGHDHYGNLLLAGPLGRAAQPLVNSGIKFLKESHLGFTQTLSRNGDHVLRYVAHVGLLPFACLAAGIGIVVGAYELVTKPFPMPRRLRITWQILRKKVLDIDPWFPMMLLVALDYLVLHMPMVVILRNVGWLALLWVALGVVKEVTSASETPTELASNADPAGLLRADRRAELASLAAALAKVGRMWLWAGSVFAIADGMRVVLGMLVILLLGGADGAWACYLETRLRLAILARLPWRTISFLDDAYRRGVLRQTGAAYRFRHIRLQQQLSDEYQPWPRSLLPIVMWTHVQLVRLRGFYPFLFPESVSGTLNANAKAVDAEEFTATIERRAGRRSLAADVVMMVAVGLLFIASSLLAPRGWPSVLLFFLLFLPGCLLLIIAVKTFDTFRAVAALPTDSWTVHAAPNVIEITRGPRQVSLTVADIELIAVRPLGNSWWSYAVQAKLQSSAISAGEEPGDWLPLFWTPGLTAKIPAPLISALGSFADGRMEQKLATWLKSRETSSTYEASGTVEVKTIPATIGPVRFAGLFAALSLTFTFLLTHQTYLATIGIVADVTFIGSWYYPLSRRAVKRKLPCGTWLLRVDPNSIEVIRADDTTRLVPTDIERIELRKIGSGPGKRAVYAQLRPEAVTRLHLSESWFLLYWTPRFTSAVPSDLVQSLAAFAAGHLVGTLKEMSESEPSTPDPRAPIKRRKLREQNTGDNGARVAN